MLDASEPAVILAPMEGVTDAPMRMLQGGTGAFTYCVSEFLRVSHAVPPMHVLYTHIPELKTAAATTTGLPVQVQLLGGDPGRLAATAVLAVECGATAIDMNFGCPAKTVNRHDGGATLLQYPQRILEIVRALRDALPPRVPVSAKLRLGWDGIDAVHENAAMAEKGGAAWITIHARTRSQGYLPPVFWPKIGQVRRAASIPVVANGDIWTNDDFKRCRDETGCVHFMLGRGALANPGLAMQVRRELGLTGGEGPVPTWRELMLRLVACSEACGAANPGRILMRMKQWLKLGAQHGNFARFDAIKQAKSIDALLAAMGETDLDRTAAF
jgi:tRNA-dihydrouridine synthase C